MFVVYVINQRMGNCYNTANQRYVILTQNYRALSLFTRHPQKTFLPLSIQSFYCIRNYSIFLLQNESLLNTVIYVRPKEEANPFLRLIILDGIITEYTTLYSSSSV